MGTCCSAPHKPEAYTIDPPKSKPKQQIKDKKADVETSDSKSTPSNSPRQTTNNLLESMGFNDDIEPANLDNFIAESETTATLNPAPVSRSSTLDKLFFEEFQVDDSGWVDFKKADYVKGRHRTQLDKQAQRYIKDIARSRMPFNEILQDLMSKYSIQRPKVGAPDLD